MYLSDREIKARLEVIDFRAEGPDHPFRADDQIQPCSVDLRLDRLFWRQSRRGSIDLRRSRLLELSPRRHWSRIELAPGESIALRPGEMLLGRTYESFTMPKALAGKLEGRSSFARMGLAVHCSADFVNPGYRGKMPLQLINFGRTTIRLFPFVPICQLMFVPLSSEPERVYGARELSSKYMEDDGGPSYWWRDKRVKELQTTLGEHDVNEAAQERILELITPSDPELIERLESLVRRSRHDELSNADELLERFAQKENRALLCARVTQGALVSLAPVLIATSLGSLFSQPFGLNEYGWLHYILWTMSIVSIPISVWALRLGIGDYFTLRKLEQLRAGATSPSAIRDRPR
jgi:deoxycytidine triphosphate deaminase